VLNGTQEDVIKAPEKIEFELKGDRLMADSDGEFILPTFSLLHLNPIAPLHSIISTFSASDTEFVNTSKQKGFFIAANRDTSGFVTKDNGRLSPQVFKATTEPFGTVYNSWTKLPVKTQLVFEGKSTIAQGQIADFRLVEMTDTDGFFAFAANGGSYKIVVNKAEGRTNNFIFPSQLVDQENITDAPYQNLYFGEEEILTQDQIIQRDIPIDPTFYGNTQNVSQLVLRKKTSSQNFKIDVLPDGKFGLFLPQGETYILEKLIGKNGAEKEINDEFTIGVSLEKSFTF
jgi:hypothetical protein